MIMNTSKEVDYINVLASVIHLRRASHLLKEYYPEMSDAILETATLIATAASLTSKDIDDSLSIVKDIQDGNA